MPPPLFTPEALAELRAQYAARVLDTRAWATAYGISLETVRRAARGDTYNTPAKAAPFPPKRPAATIIPPSVHAPAPVIPPAERPPAGRPEPTAEELAASMARLAELQARERARPDAGRLLDELTGDRGPVEPA